MLLQLLQFPANRSMMYPGLYMHGIAVEILPGRRRKTALVTHDSIDGRSHAARRVRALIRAMQRELGHKPTALETSAIQRAAVLQAIAEDARTRLLRGDKNVTYDDVIRADGCARRALRDLRAVRDTNVTRLF
jgi:hypothetical protein